MAMIDIPDSMIKQAISEILDSAAKKYGEGYGSNKIETLVNDVIRKHEDELQDILWRYIKETVTSEEFKKSLDEVYAKRLADAMLNRLKKQYS